MRSIPYIGSTDQLLLRLIIISLLRVRVIVMAKKPKEDVKKFLIRFDKSGFHVFVRLFGLDRGLCGRMTFSPEEWELFSQSLSTIAVIKDDKG